MHVARQITPTVASWKRPRHLVLTVKSQTGSLRDQVVDLVRWFGKLRRTAWWKQNVYAGVYTIEITINERTGLWHPHLHILFDGQYLPQAKLRYLWHDITGGSDIVWIGEVYNTAGAVNEVCKYIGKPQDSEHWTDQQLTDYAKAVRGLRMVQPFGRKNKLAIEDTVPEKPLSDNESSVSLASLLWEARRDSRTAAQALKLVAHRFPHIGRYIYLQMPMLEPDKTVTEKMLAAWRIIEHGTAPPPELAAAHADHADIEARLADALGDFLQEQAEKYR